MMANGWATIPLGEVLTERRETPPPGAVETGRIRIISKIRFHDGGIELREDGGTRTKMILVRPGDFVVSGINAAKGAIAVYDKTNADSVAATIHYAAYKADNNRVDTRYLWWLFRSNTFRTLLDKHIPGGIKTELKAKRLLPIPVPLPDRGEQGRLVAKLDALTTKLEEARTFYRQTERNADAMLHSAFASTIADAPLCKMDDVAPLVRRQVEIQMREEYPELGIRSFGKGTFHKPALDFLSVGTKRLYRIEPGDLLFSNVFAWEGAIAVAQPEDKGRFGSHRFITCVPKEGVATSEFLRFYYLTAEGLRKIGEASPGGAGRNRTLGLTKLAVIEVPVPVYEKQVWFNRLQAKVSEMRATQQDAETGFNGMLPSILDRAFKGEL